MVLGLFSGLAGGALADGLWKTAMAACLTPLRSAGPGDRLAGRRATRAGPPTWAMSTVRATLVVAVGTGQGSPQTARALSMRRPPRYGSAPLLEAASPRRRCPSMRSTGRRGSRPPAGEQMGERTWLPAVES